MDFKSCYDCRHYELLIEDSGCVDFCIKENRRIPEEELQREHACSEEETYHCGHA